MMFWSERLRVVLATVHIPLAEVPAAITHERLLDVDPPDGGVAAAVRIRLAVARRRRAQSARRRARPARPRRRRRDGAGDRRGAREGLDVVGPFPADTLFVRAARGEFDVVIAAYHDQGLVPVKLLAFGRAVNVTLGLPIIRTSVDHGTAFDIARRGDGRRGQPGRSDSAGGATAGGQATDPRRRPSHAPDPRPPSSRRDP